MKLVLVRLLILLLCTPDTVTAASSRRTSLEEVLQAVSCISRIRDDDLTQELLQKRVERCVSRITDARSLGRLAVISRALAEPDEPADGPYQVAFWFSVRRLAKRGDTEAISTMAFVRRSVSLDGAGHQDFEDLVRVQSAIAARKLPYSTDRPSTGER